MYGFFGGDIPHLYSLYLLYACWPFDNSDSLISWTSVSRSLVNLVRSLDRHSDISRNCLHRSSCAAITFTGARMGIVGTDVKVSYACWSFDNSDSLISFASVSRSLASLVRSSDRSLDFPAVACTPLPCAHVSDFRRRSQPSSSREREWRSLVLIPIHLS